MTLDSSRNGNVTNNNGRLRSLVLDIV